MDRLVEFLDNSRLSRLIAQEEAGEPVDYAKAARLQALDVARVGELFVLDVIEAEREADEQFRATLAQ